MPKYILWFPKVDKNDVSKVGGKGANLGEMLKAGIPVPPGFIVTAEAYFEFLKKTALSQKIKTELKSLDLNDSQKLSRASKNIKNAILAAKIPPKIQEEIKNSYQKLCGTHDLFVAVRSSATAEDLPEASFAGQMKTFLNVKGASNLVQAVQGCWASLFTPRAIFYREDRGYGHLKVGIAVPVQLMIDSKVSGVLFTSDPLTNDPAKISIEAAFGLGETVVSGALTPDQYLVDKKTLKILDKKIVPQPWEITRAGKIPISKAYQRKQKLSDKYILKLSDLGKKIEEHYKFPQDIEWAFAKGNIWIVQTRPVTTTGIGYRVSGIKDKEIDEKLLLAGIGASPGIAWGPVQIVRTPLEIKKVDKGEILVTEMTNPDFVPAMRKAVAIVTDKGGRTSHAAIVSRELGIPCVVGTKQATVMLKTGEVITVDGSEGKIYQGELEVEKLVGEEQEEKWEQIKTATKLYVNLGEPELAAATAQRNVDGVGLLRAEFMIAKMAVHPRKFIEEGKEKEFIKKLSQGILEFAKNFYPRPIIYRTTDFKTSEYAHLKGGEKYEKEEPNPFLGFRGALRYLTDPEVFKLEIEALKFVRNKKGFKNLHLMIPFVRTVKELVEVKKLISSFGLKRSANFKLWLMVEVPSNVILLSDFIKAEIDGVSIGSNDLTMLTLGVDRDNPEVAKGFDELNPAVLDSLERVIKTCKKFKITSSICGQAPSFYPSLTKKLVRWGITSISINPDVIGKTRKLIYEAEKELVRRK